MSAPILAGVTWWPHSGGRWFCRSILNQHSRVLGAQFVQPWLFFTTDMTLAVDVTAQVHKARSLPELGLHLQGLKQSVDAGRLAGLKHYFNHARAEYVGDSGKTHIIGEMCLGSPEPRPLDVELLFEACPDFRLIHLVRNPTSSYPSFASRHEMDGNAARIAGSWVTLNGAIRTFFETRPDLAERYLRVRYEDLLEDLRPTLQAVCNFLDLPLEEEMFESLGDRWGRNTASRTPAEASKIIQRIVGPEAEAFGYR